MNRLLSKVIFVAISIFLISCVAKKPIVSESSIIVNKESEASKWFAANSNRPPKLRAFLKKMPKGGDLHTHVSGAVYAESYLKWAADENLCVNPTTAAISEKNHAPCNEITEVPITNAFQNSELYGHLIDKLSLRNFKYANQSGHDQFFEAFAKFNGGTKGMMIAELSNRAAKQNIAYLEMMLSIGKKFSKKFSKQVKFNGDIGATYNKLIAAGLQNTIVNGQQELAQHEQQATEVLKCNTVNAQPGCSVERRYVLQIIRIKNPSRVFSQLVYAFEMVKADLLAVGLNMVAPEDDVVSLKDYDLHMKMVGYLSKQYPNVSISLHAGELTLGLVPPKQLTDHIQKAVTIANAKRIGHGVDIFYEDNPFQLMRNMKAKELLVEICLSSNDLILGVKGEQHPFPEYLEAGVPVTLATDDEGISRIDLTHEYQRAVQDYNLTYPEVKTLVRNSIHYSFLAGESLWTDRSYQQLNKICQQSNSDSCKLFLQKNDKANMQWKLEQQFVKFENSEWF
ncbi:hypothetical protein QUF50_03190 [Thiotrichales bacterium HSG1]|nr:hypothetical protein [Thiotrichales bacterium HSG1]